MVAYTFSHYLSQLMQKHQLSVAALSAIVGSRADLKQILSDDATHTKRERLYQKLRSCHLFEETEYQALELSLEISRKGIESFRFAQAIFEILSGKTQEADSPIVTDQGLTLSEKFDALKKAGKIEIICFNCCYRALFDALFPLFADIKRDISLRHYVQTDGGINAAAEYTAVVLPLLFDERYTAYYRSATLESKLPCIGGNQLFIRAVIGNEMTEMMFAISGNMVAYELPNASSCHMFAFISRVLQGAYPQPIAIKETNPYNADFPSLCMTFLSHELNRATYYIGSDLCFQQIPTDIAIAAFKDKGLPSQSDVMSIISRTLSVHEQRYQNQYRKKKATYRIMTQSGCERFLATGEMTDHFVGFRPFTPEERKVIFGNMLQAARENSCFIPLLLKNIDFSHVYNLVCYEKLGISIDAKDTDYNIAEGYRSVFLMHPEFTKQYQAFYLDTLVAEKCYSRGQSLKLLEEMYDRFLLKNNLSR